MSPTENRRELSTEQLSASDHFDRILRLRLADIDSARYEKQTRSVVERFIDYVTEAEDIAVSSITDVDKQVVRRYARYLSQRTEAGEISGATAYKNWQVVSSFLNWSVEEGLLTKNPCKLKAAKAPLPERESSSDTQFWSERERDAICTATYKYVDEWTSNDDATAMDRLKAYRDRAVVHALAYSGCRVGELVSDPTDEKRTGITWEDIDLATGTMAVFGKTRETQYTPILEAGMEPLAKWRELLDAPAEWPVFPSAHLPTLYDLLPDAVEPDHTRIWEQLQEEDRSPPAMTTNGVRNLLEDLCNQSEYDFDEPLLPHGARRGLGKRLYRDDSETAQDMLRHSSIETTHQSYRDESAREVKERADAIVDDE